MGGYSQLPVTPYRPQQSDPLETYGKIMALRNMGQEQQLRQGQQQLQQGQIEQQQIALNSTKAMMRAYADAKGDPEQTMKLGAQYGADPGMLMKAQEGFLKIGQERANKTKAELENESKLAELIGQHTQAALNLPPEQRPQAVQRIVTDFVQKGIMPPQQAMQSLQQYQALGDDYLRFTATSAMKTKEQADLALNAPLKLAQTQEAQAGTQLKQMQIAAGGTSDVDKYISNWLRERNLPNTAANWAKAHEAWTQETKIQPASIRISGLQESRGMPVTDTKTGVTAPMSWADYNKLSKAEPGRYTSPQYDAQTQIGIKAWRDLAPSGAVGKQVTSYDTFLRHTGDLYDAVSSLNNTNFPYMNKTINWMRNNTGDPRVKSFLAKLDPVKKEFESFLLNNRALYEDDRKDAKSIIDENASPAQMLAVLPSLGHTATARMGATNESFKRATGEDIPNLISPEAQQVIQKLGVKPGQSGSVQPVYAKNPQTGQRVVSSDGGKTWQPAQ